MIGREHGARPRQSGQPGQPEGAGQQPEKGEIKGDNAQTNTSVNCMPI